jgi:hypothetical protein
MKVDFVSSVRNPLLMLKFSLPTFYYSATFVFKFEINVRKLLCRRSPIFLYNGWITGSNVAFLLQNLEPTTWISFPQFGNILSTFLWAFFNFTYKNDDIKQQGEEKRPANKITEEKIKPWLQREIQNLFLIYDTSYFILNYI